MQPNSCGKSGIIDVRRTETRIEKYLLLNMLQITLAYPNIDSILNPSIVKCCFHQNSGEKLSKLNFHLPAINFSHLSWSPLQCRNPPWQDSFPSYSVKYCNSYHFKNSNNVFGLQTDFFSAHVRHYSHISKVHAIIIPFRQIVSNITAGFLIRRFRYTSNLPFALWHNKYKLVVCIKLFITVQWTLYIILVRLKFYPRNNCLTIWHLFGYQCNT